MPHSKQNFEDVIKKLLALGENQKEMHFWVSIFDDLDESEKADVLENLSNELAALESKKN